MVVRKSYHFAHTFQTQQPIRCNAAEFRRIGTQFTTRPTQQDLSTVRTAVAAAVAGVLPHTVRGVRTGSVTWTGSGGCGGGGRGATVVPVRGSAVDSLLRQGQQIVQGVYAPGSTVVAVAVVVVVVGGIVVVAVGGIVVFFGRIGRGAAARGGRGGVVVVLVGRGGFVLLWRRWSGVLVVNVVVTNSIFHLGQQCIEVVHMAKEIQLCTLYISEKKKLGVAVER